MSSLYSIFPMRREWPRAVDDGSGVPIDANSMRLVSGAKNIWAKSKNHASVTKKCPTPEKINRWFSPIGTDRHAKTARSSIKKALMFCTFCAKNWATKYSGRASDFSEKRQEGKRSDRSDQCCQSYFG